MSRLAKLLSPRSVLRKVVSELIFARDFLAGDPAAASAELDLTDRYDATDDGSLIDRLVRAYGAAKQAQALGPEGPYHVGGAWKHDIQRRRGDRLRALERRDPAMLQALFKNFMRNSGVAGLYVHRYFEQIRDAGLWDRAHLKRDLVRDWRLWGERTAGARAEELAPPSVGNPWGVRVAGTLVTMGSLRFHYCAGRVRPLLHDLPEPVLCEIGGGYGGFAYFLLKGERARLTYVDFDIPEVLLVASYYLLKSYPTRKALLYR